MKHILPAFFSLVLAATTLARAGEPPPPRMKALLLPGDEVSFQRDGIELTRLVFGRGGQYRARPFLFPVFGPSGNPLTISHAHDAEGATHNSIWHSYGDINGIAFEGNHPNSSGREIFRKIENLTSGATSAAATFQVDWVDVAKNPPETLMVEHRRYTIQPFDKGEWLLLVDSQFEAAADVSLGQSPISFFSVKLAEAMSINGGGHNRDSNGGADLNGVAKKPARWIDGYGYPNPDAKESILKIGNNGVNSGFYGQPNPNKAVIEGIALFDHPKNPNYPTFWRARTHGRLMTSGVTADGAPLKLKKGKTLRYRWGAYIHGDQPASAIEAQWEAFSKTEIDDLAQPRSTK